MKGIIITIGFFCTGTKAKWSLCLVLTSKSGFHIMTSIELHKTLCSNHLLLNENAICIKVNDKNNSEYNICTTISLPFLFTEKVDNNIGQWHCIKILMGFHKVYVSL